MSYSNFPPSIILPCSPSSSVCFLYNALFLFSALSTIGLAFWSKLLYLVSFQSPIFITVDCQGLLQVLDCCEILTNCIGMKFAQNPIAVQEKKYPIRYGHEKEMLKWRPWNSSKEHEKESLILEYLVGEVLASRASSCPCRILPPIYCWVDSNRIEKMVRKGAKTKSYHPNSRTMP